MRREGYLFYGSFGSLKFAEPSRIFFLTTLRG